MATLFPRLARRRVAVPVPAFRWTLTAALARQGSFAPSCCSNENKILHDRLTAFYISQGDPAQSAAEVASEEIHWLRKRAYALAQASSDPSKDPDQEQRRGHSNFQHMVDQLVREHKPLAYILGESMVVATTCDQPFHPLRVPLKVQPPLLIPRPETEYWVNQLATLLPSNLPFGDTPYRLLDIGTGTGCIPLALVQALLDRPQTSGSSPVLSPPLQALGVDRSPLSISCATHNAKINDLSAHCHFTLLDLFDPSTLEKLSPPFHLIVSNPPYIPLKEWANLAPTVKDWEDEKALVAGEDGLVFYSRIVELLPQLLHQDGGMVALEVGKGQAPIVREMLEDLGMKVEVIVDQWGVERCVVGSSIGTKSDR
ncbi:BZ3500_MvSof-1268-A1-R1_Chr9g10630 [Microbotryum saponariae]|uniref:BZ3500_MvSof-1268-A1-R1_Chr9g10630 protein n=1 Tax=Microbotryum saponariae TaxID=289078 RepID=A0A2X0L7B2_9BASI|nr:BZ3501_MvSof-1269-A2-R1_Chr9g10378 [Microbotryum saponariae]SDA00418.1 BZ3500_MvSof-1268-A1-R1_Chr9g10630 [Microbotryum saponariae]